MVHASKINLQRLFLKIHINILQTWNSFCFSFSFTTTVNKNHLFKFHYTKENTVSTTQTTTSKWEYEKGKRIWRKHCIFHVGKYQAEERRNIRRAEKRKNLSKTKPIVFSPWRHFTHSGVTKYLEDIRRNENWRFHCNSKQSWITKLQGKFTL